MIKIYGIKNCNSVKKAFEYLNNKKISYEFHDYKKLGISKNKLEEFLQYFGLEKLLNNKGMTWRKLSEDQQKKSADKDFAINLMLENTSMIKRPIVDLEIKKLIGFDEDEYDNIFKKDT